MSLLQNKATLPIVVVIVAAGIGALLFFQNSGSGPNASEVGTHQTADGNTQTASAPEGNPLITPRILGNPDAPVTMIEYSSMTCPHCASFHRDALPLIKKNYIDTGKLKLEMRDFPLNDGAVLGSLLARCAPEDRYFALVDLLFAQQQAWARSEGMIGELARIGGFAGMSQDDLQACFENEELFQAIREQREVWASTHEITSTPTFYINGVQVRGSQSYEEFERVIEEALN